MTVYAIDFDTRTVESKSEDAEELAGYIIDNGLSMAVAMVEGEDDLSLGFSMAEMSDLYSNITMDDLESKTEDEAAQTCWKALEEAKDDFPKFTKALGKKLLKAAAKRSKDSAKPSPNPVKESAPRKPRDPSKPRAPKTTDAAILLISTEPKANNLLHKPWQIVEDNFGEMSFGGLVKDYMEQHDLEERLARRYIQKAIRTGTLEIKLDV